MISAFIKLHISIIFAGWTGIFGKLITMSPGLIVLYRVVFGGAMLWAWMFYKKQIQPIDVKYKVTLCLIGALLMLQWSFFYSSISVSNVSITVVAFSSQGFFSALYEPIFNKRKILFEEISYSLLTIVGIALIFHFDTQYQLGIIFGLLAGASAGVIAVWHKAFLKITDANTLMAWQFVGAFVAVIFALPYYRHFMPPESLWPSGLNLVYLLIFASFCTLGMYLLQISAMKKISAFTATLSYNLEPIYSIILAMILFDEGGELSWSFYVGLLLIIVSVALQSIKVCRSSNRNKNIALNNQSPQK